MPYHMPIGPLHGRQAPPAAPPNPQRAGMPTPNPLHGRQAPPAAPLGRDAAVHPFKPREDLPPGPRERIRGRQDLVCLRLAAGMEHAANAGAPTGASRGPAGPPAGRRAGCACPPPPPARAEAADLESLIETLAILADHDFVMQIEKSKDDPSAGRVVPWVPAERRTRRRQTRRRGCIRKTRKGSQRTRGRIRGAPGVWGGSSPGETCSGRPRRSGRWGTAARSAAGPIGGALHGRPPSGPRQRRPAALWRPDLPVAHPRPGPGARRPPLRPPDARRPPLRPPQDGNRSLPLLHPRP